MIYVNSICSINLTMFSIHLSQNDKGIKTVKNQRNVNSIIMKESQTEELSKFKTQCE